MEETNYTFRVSKVDEDMAEGLKFLKGFLRRRNSEELGTKVRERKLRRVLTYQLCRRSGRIFRCTRLTRVRECTAIRREVLSRNGRRNFLGETTGGVMERGRSSKSTWGGLMQMRFTFGVATAGLLAASAPPGERKRSWGNVPSKWNAKSWTARSSVNLVARWGDESLAAREDFQSLLMAY